MRFIDEAAFAEYLDRTRHMADIAKVERAIALLESWGIIKDDGKGSSQADEDGLRHDDHVHREWFG